MDRLTHKQHASLEDILRGSHPQEVVPTWVLLPGPRPPQGGSWVLGADRRLLPKTVDEVGERG